MLQDLSNLYIGQHSIIHTSYPHCVKVLTLLASIAISLSKFFSGVSVHFLHVSFKRILENIQLFWEVSEGLLGAGMVNLTHTEVHTTFPKIKLSIFHTKLGKQIK